MTPPPTHTLARLRAWTQRVLGMLSLLGLSACLVACGGGGGSTPRFTWDATTSTLKDNTTGLYWKGVTPGDTLTSGQRYPTVDELLLLTDKATLSDIPTQFSATLLNNDLVFAGDINYSAAGALWAVSFASDSRGLVYYDAQSTDRPTEGSAKQPVVVSGSAAAFNRSRASSNYALTTNRGVIYDTQNDLSWKMCSEGATAGVLSCSGTPTRFTLSQLTQFQTANRTDGWRLPTKYELEGLIDRSRGELLTPATYMINSDVFDPQTDSNTWWTFPVGIPGDSRIYWTDSQLNGGANHVVVSFRTGAVFLPDPTYSSYFVRLVRNGKY
ncbi:DUF1566 domain-containing protein [Limnohabitans sp.]|uniref:Lcl C-terminal domain-containing protein n=1 Tax=Limnohabitans sp. TaxID=1907725 RepID=UPI0038B90919